MTNPKRWDLVDQGDTTLTERTDGDYVTFEDYEVLRGNLSLAEEGLANYALEVEHLHGRWSEALANVTARNQEIERLRASFKNFHRLLCERFDYGHDEADWERDQLSLIEWIAKRHAHEPSEPLANWQPIETAPKDGTHILALFHGESYWPVRVLRWGGDQSLWGLPGHCGLEPTHWMPLPANPTAQGASRGAGSHYCIDCNEAHDPRTCGALKSGEQS